MKWLFGGQRLITIACVFGLTSIAFTSWAVLDPRPLVVIAAMSIGQGIGILGVVAFLIIVLRDPEQHIHRAHAAVLARMVSDVFQ